MLTTKRSPPPGLSVASNVQNTRSTRQTKRRIPLGETGEKSGNISRISAGEISYALVSQGGIQKFFLAVRRLRLFSLVQHSLRRSLGRNSLALLPFVQLRQAGQANWSMQALAQPPGRRADGRRRQTADRGHKARPGRKGGPSESCRTSDSRPLLASIRTNTGVRQYVVPAPGLVYFVLFLGWCSLLISGRGFLKLTNLAGSFRPKREKREKRRETSAPGLALAWPCGGWSKRCILRSDGEDGCSARVVLSLFFLSRARVLFELWMMTGTCHCRCPKRRTKRRRRKTGRRRRWSSELRMRGGRPKSIKASEPFSSNQSPGRTATFCRLERSTGTDKG